LLAEFACERITWLSKAFGIRLLSEFQVTDKWLLQIFVISLLFLIFFSSEKGCFSRFNTKTNSLQPLQQLGIVVEVIELRVLAYLREWPISSHPSFTTFQSSRGWIRPIFRHPFSVSIVFNISIKFNFQFLKCSYLVKTISNYTDTDIQHSYNKKQYFLL